MKFSAVSLWNTLTTVQPTRPAARTARWVGSWCILCIVVGLGELALKFAGLASERSFSVADWSGVILALVVSSLGGWIFWRDPWAKSGTFERQRGRIIAVIGIVQLGLNLLALLPSLLQSPTTQVFSLLLVLLSAQTLWLALRGRVRLAGTLQVGQLLLFAVSAGSAQTSMAIIGNLMIVSATVVLSGLLVYWWLGLVLAAVLPCLVAALIIFDAPGQALPPWLIPIIIGNMFIGAIVALYARSLEKAMRIADARDMELTAASAALRGQNAALERRAAQLRATQESLRQTVADQEQRIADAVAELRARSVELSSLQTPLIRIAPGVLVAPLVGAWDNTRAEAFTGSLLRGVEQQHARIVVLDLTGLAAMSEGVAQMVLRVVTATRLLGCRCVLVGVQPESAQALVSLGIDLSNIETGADLADGVALSLGKDLTADRYRISG